MTLHTRSGSGGRRRGDESGSIAVMAGTILLAVLVATSLAVDVGRVGFVSRDQQGVTDRAALDSVTVLTLATSPVTLAGMHDTVEGGIDASLGRNVGPSGRFPEDLPTLLELGNVVDGVFTAACSEPYDLTAPATCPGAASDATAVRVVSESFVPFVFALGDAEGGRTVTREAVAENLAMGQVRVGSELAGLRGGLLEDLLADIFCAQHEIDPGTGDPVPIPGTSIGGSCKLDIGAVNYNGLIGATVALGDILDHLDIAAGTPTSALDSDIRAVDFLEASAKALDDQGMTAEASALRQTALRMNSAFTVNLGKMFNIQTGTVGQAADMQVDMLDVLQSSAQMINGQSLLDVTDTMASVPGVADVTAGARVIEPPQRSAFGAPVVTAHTGQARLELETELSMDLANEVTSIVRSLVGLLGTVNVTATPVVLPVQVEVARATADLDAIRCGDPANVTQSDTEADVTTSTDVVRLTIGDGTTWVDVARVAVKVSIPLVGSANVVLDVRARADAPLGGTSADTHTFHGPYEAGPEHTGGSAVDFGDLAATGIAYDIQASGSLGILGAVLGDLEAGIEGAINVAALPAIGALDTALQPALDTLGVELGNADTWVTQVKCGARRLAWQSDAEHL